LSALAFSSAAIWLSVKRDAVLRHLGFERLETLFSSRPDRGAAIRSARQQAKIDKPAPF